MSAFLNWFTDSNPLDWTIRLMHAAAVGQTLFVAMWMTLPWWRTPVGRALMVKSASLAIYLDFAVANYHWGPWPHQLCLALGLFSLVAIGIWSQVFAIGHEMRRHRADLPDRRH